MTALFTLPGQVPLSSGAILAGAKLYFSQTGTSTPQNTYQDEALATPHANPVVADASGLFAAIYLDPSLPSYRAVLKTSADVTISTWDGVPSNLGTQQSMRFASTNPFIFLYDSDGTANSRKFRIKVSGDTFYIEASNDAENSFTTLLSASSSVLTLQNNARINGNSIATYNSGSFTGTLTGVSGTVTGTIRYMQTGNTVVLHLPAISGTSNATTMTITGLPSALRPGTSTEAMLCRVTDNGTASIGVVSIAASTGVMSFGLGASSGAFTGSGTKGVTSNVLVYSQ